MYHKLYKQFIVLLFTFIVSSCGGGGGDNPTTENNSKDSSVLSENIISGTAAKGIIKNGVVKVYGISNGQKKSEALAESNTDNNGEYSLTVNNYTGPLFVEISADPNKTKMICDINPSCGDVAFGDEIQLDEDFSIKAVVELEANKEAVANVSAITSLVATFAEEQSNIDSTIISNANSQVANLFGMTGKLSEKPIIDITNEISLRDASDDVLQMAVLNSAIASSMGDDVSISRGLENIMNEFKNNNGQFYNNTDDNSISVAVIYFNAKEILNMSVFSNVEVGNLKESVALKQAVAKNQPPNSKSDVLPTEIPESIYIESAKAMVEDIRELSLQATYEKSNEASVASELAAAFDLVNSDEYEALTKALDTATLAFEEAYLEWFYEYEDNTSVNDTYVYDDGYNDEIPVKISTTNGVVEYSIDNEINSIKYQLKAKYTGKSDTKSKYGEFCWNSNYSLGDDDYLDLEYDQLKNESSNGFFELEGSLKGQDLEMNNIKGEVSVKYDCSYFASNVNSEEKVTFDDYSTASMNLDLEIIETTPEPLSFSGKFELNTELSTTYKSDSNDHDEEHGDHDYHDDDYHEDDSPEAFQSNSYLVLSGEFEKNNKKIGATITATVSDNKGDLWANGDDLSNTNTNDPEEYSNSEDVNFYNILDVFPFPDVLEIETDSLSETNASVGISLSFTTSSKSDITGIDLVTSNKSKDSRQWGLDIALGNKRLNFDYNPSMKDSELTVVNQSGTTLKLSESCFEEEQDCADIGSIMVNDEQTATVSLDRSDDVFVITYKDGTSEPLGL
ncbi:MAG: hypothetical protein ACPHZD_04755 [Porticoccaceae bacterium]